MIEQGEYGVVKVTLPSHDYYGHALLYDDDRPARNKAGWEALCLLPGGNRFVWIAPKCLHAADEVAVRRFKNMAVGLTKAMIALQEAGR